MRSPRHLHKKLHTLESRYDGRQTQVGGKIGAVKASPRRSRTVLSGSQHSRILQPDTCSDCCISFGAGHLLRQPAHSLVHPKGKISSPSRTESRKPARNRKPPELVATDPNQMWSWDITWLKTDVKGLFLFAYVILDIFSRKIVGWSIEES